MIEQTVTYKGQRYPVIPDIDDAAEELMSRKARGEMDIVIIDASTCSDKTGYFIAEVKKPGD